MEEQETNKETKEEPKVVVEQSHQSLSIQVGEVMVSSPYDSLDYIYTTIIRLLDEDVVKKYLTEFNKKKLKGGNYVG